MPAKKQPPVDFEAHVKNYLDKKVSVVDMATAMQCAKATVLKWMDEAGVQRYPRGTMISVKKTGRPSTRIGVKLSDATRQKLSVAMKGNARTKGFKFSAESIEKMRASAKLRMATTDSLKKMKEGRDKLRASESERVAIVKARDACKRMLRRVLTMARVKKDGRRHELLLGYTKSSLREHLEKQFLPGMSWDVRGSFHIDHIKPVAQFFREGIYDPAVINALSNLQVLTPEANRAKSDKYSFSEKNRKQALIIDRFGTRPWTS